MLCRVGGNLHRDPELIFEVGKREVDGLEDFTRFVVKTLGDLLRRHHKICCAYLRGFVEKIGKDLLSGLEEICFQDLKRFVERS